MSALTNRYVDKLDPKCVAHQVVCQHRSTLQACICPVVPVWIGNVQLGDRNGVDLVRRLGYGALHCQLVLVGQDRGHGGGALRMSKRECGFVFVALGVVLPAQRGLWCSMLYAPIRHHMNALVSHSSGLRRGRFNGSMPISRALHSPQAGQEWLCWW